MKYISFKEHGTSASGKTKIWDVVNTGGVFLGYISWHAPWRRYTFAPTISSVFDANCLKDITDFVQLQNDIHKNKVPIRTLEEV